MALDCIYNSLTFEQLMSALLTRNEDGNCAIRLIPVAAGDPDDDWSKDCDHATHTESDKLRLVLGVDGDGKVGIRVILGVSVNENCINCDNQNIPFGDQIWNHVIGTADDGLPALRLAQPAP